MQDIINHQCNGWLVASIEADTAGVMCHVVDDIEQGLWSVIYLQSTLPAPTMKTKINNNKN